jgi:hypothetical protein
MDYSRKYKKYKLKYLSLKETLIGGDFGKPSPIPAKTPSDMLSYLMENNGKLDEKLFSSYILNYMKSVIQTPDFLKASDIPFYIPLVSAFYKYNRDADRAKEFDDLMVGFLGFVDVFGKTIADVKLVEYWNDIIMKRKEGSILIYPKISTEPVAPKISIQPAEFQSPTKPLPQRPPIEPKVPSKQLPTPWKSVERSAELTVRPTTPILGSRRLSTGQ